MAEMYDPVETREQHRAKQRRFKGSKYPKLPPDAPDGMKGLYADLVSQAEARPDGEERDQTLRAIHALVADAETMSATADPGFTESPYNKVTEFTTPAGEWARRETDDHGRVRTTITPRDVQTAVESESRAFANEAGEINLMFREADRLSEAAGIFDGPLGEDFRQRASALREQARSRREATRETRIAQLTERGMSPEQARRHVTAPGAELSYKFGETPPAEGRVAEALELMKAGKLSDALALGLDPAERYEVRRQLGTTEAADILDTAGTEPAETETS